MTMMILKARGLFYLQRLAEPASELGFEHVITPTQNSGMQLFIHSLTSTVV